MCMSNDDFTEFKNVHVLTKEEWEQRKKDIAAGMYKSVGSVPSAERDALAKLAGPVDMPETLEELRAMMRDVRDDM